MVTEKIRSKKGFVCLSPASLEDIQIAELDLGTSFAKDYREYVSAFGAASFVGHELTGVCKSKALNVVATTLKERRLNSEIPQSLYLLENTNIDEVTIWQSSDGSVYRISPEKITKLCASISEYLEI